jgi:hypothetical protein
MALTTYGGLKTAVASWLKRSDLTSNIPDLISLAEARIARDLRIRAQISFDTLTTSKSVDYVTLPSDFLEVENISLEGDFERPLTYETPEQLDARFPLGSQYDRPAAYTIIGSRIVFGPAPDAAYSIKFTYYARFDALSADADTNWILTNHPSVYLFAALAEAAPFILDDERATLWEAKYQADMKSLQDADDESLRSGSVLRVRYV